MDSEAKLSQKADSSFTMDDFAKALEKHDYQFQKGQVVKGKVFQIDHDGAFVDIGGKASAFLPRDEASLRTVTNLSEILPLHEPLEFVIIREQDAEGQVTLSRRQLEIRHIWERLAQMQESSQTVKALVTGVNKGGVNIEVFGLRGFIPRSHLIERDNLEALKGQTLTTAFLEVDSNNKRLILSQRMAARSANFSMLAIGQLIEGKVTGIKPFGVFVDLNGISALLHIKQVTQKFIDNLEKVFQMNQQIKAVIIDIDEGKGRVALSTRILENFPGELLENMEEVMTSAEARAERAKNKTAE
ncbi:S1 RNA-binding domain-containing protein [Brunnivagina elsteri]|uniref:30S ribosomal protein S1 n=1 Tax=Brunnivagina elsteri CCALA 953 TaxID=987040 RepID=A0A2A2TL90_9CYAN|nr:S1 RNA-binding domain-containing protein [Calothrix elsteri]PAX58075.1 30S ribosomal protein S1 [Calothrix elsteri CCALA 953]